MTIPVTAIPYWQQFTRKLAEGRSLISHAPRHSLQAALIQYLKRSYRDLGATHIVVIHPDQCIRGAEVDWPECGNQLARQLGAPGLPTGDPTSFRRALSGWLDANPEARLLVSIGLGTASSVEGRFELMSALHHCLDEQVRYRALTVAACDDYSLYYYEWWRTQGISRWDYFHRWHLRSTRKAEIVDVLRTAFPDMADVVLESAAVQTERLTGGHVGLLNELIEDALDRNGFSEEYWRDVAPPLLERSQIVESIRRGLLEDLSGLTQRALEYEPAKPARDYSSPTVQKLRALGVLQWTSTASARICPGVVHSMVRDLAKEADTPEVVGTVFQDSGSSLYLPKSLAVSDDDITIVHLSDIHLGAPYAFRTSRAGSDRHDRRSAAEMIAEDLKASGIRRVDAFVFSGDFTECGELSEFRKARDVLSELLEATGASWQQAVIVAGNHDIRWKLGPNGEPVKPPEVSRDEYATFRELVGKNADPQAEIHLVVSKSGKSAVRVVALDTNLVEGPEAGGIGYISLDALQSVSALLAQHDLPDTVERVSTWVVVHHHVFPVNSAFFKAARTRHVSVMANAAALLSFAVSWETELILHGHEHQPSVTISRRWPIERGEHMMPLCVAGAGSFGCRREFLGPFARNHYFIHVRRSRDILIRSRMIGDEGFGWIAHGDIAVPVSEPVTPFRSSPRAGNSLGSPNQHS